jgi:murein DD-endopeptidase MepM/ murein hydrolase activator NlpD
LRAYIRKHVDAVRAGSENHRLPVKAIHKTSFILTVFISSFFVDPAISHQPDQQIIPLKQGEVFLLRLDLQEEPSSSYVLFQEKKIPLFKLPTPGVYGALIGIDLAMKPSRYNIDVKGIKGNPQYLIEVVPSDFGVQKLTLPEDQVTLDDETLKRVEKEQEEISSSMAGVTEDKYWEKEFIIPVEGKIAGRFGVRRILNGQPRSPHSGEDFSAPQGTSVRASNAGRVVLVGDYFFSGRSVIIDHGLGVYTMYFHLHDYRVNVGEVISRGAVIGTVGATGRATGPHLHWGVRILGARVNPLSVVDLGASSSTVVVP